MSDGDHYRNSLILNFERGTVYRNIGPQRSLTDSDLGLIMKVDGKRERMEHVELKQVSGGYQWENFSRAVHGEKLEGEILPEQVVAGLEVIEAMARATESGGVAEVKEIKKPRHPRLLDGLGILFQNHLIVDQRDHKRYE